MVHRPAEELVAGLDDVRRSPADAGRIQLLVRRPSPAAREVVPDLCLDVVQGVVGDSWLSRGSRRTPDGSADLAAQLTVMNVRAALLVAGSIDQVPLAGDQIYVDMDISVDNLPPGTLLAVGSAVVEVSAKPHTGCAKFVARFGADAMRFVNSPAGRRMRLRGMNARIVSSGIVRVGDEMVKQVAERVV